MSSATVSSVMLGLLRTCRMKGLSDLHIEYSYKWCLGWFMLWMSVRTFFQNWSSECMGSAEIC